MPDSTCVHCGADCDDLECDECKLAFTAPDGVDDYTGTMLNGDDELRFGFTFASSVAGI